MPALSAAESRRLIKLGAMPGSADSLAASGEECCTRPAATEMGCCDGGLVVTTGLVSASGVETGAAGGVTGGGVTGAGSGGGGGAGAGSGSTGAASATGSAICTTGSATGSGAGSANAVSSSTADGSIDEDCSALYCSTTACGASVASTALNTGSSMLYSSTAAAGSATSIPLTSSSAARRSIKLKPCSVCSATSSPNCASSPKSVVIRISSGG